jgi:thiamine-monophosphate kinase
VIRLPEGEALVVAVDTLVAGVHFPLDTRAEDVGHKALAVNLSDLAAMAATPAGYSIALCLPSRDDSWTAAFEAGLHALARTFGLAPVATHRAAGPLSVTVEVYGHAPPGAVLHRRGARPDDGVYVTGSLGDAALALQALLGLRVLAGEALATLRARLDRPEPRVRVGLALRGIATAAIDVSDGLAADLGHVLTASEVGATLEVTRLPLSPALRDAVDPGTAARLALGGGDDYEICFTAPAATAAEIDRLARDLGCPVARIGTIEARQGLRCVAADGTPMPIPAGYQHFAADPAGSREGTPERG